MERAARLRSSLLLVTIVTWLSPAPAAATTLSSDGFRFDIADYVGASGTIIDGTTDAYDNCYYLEVDGTAYTVREPFTTSLDGRQVDLPSTEVAAGLFAERHVYVPERGGWARYVDVVSNPSAVEVSARISIWGNLGSDGSTVLVGTSSGDRSLTTEDRWLATDDTDGTLDPSLAHLFQGEGPPLDVTSVTLDFDNISYGWDVTVPAGGRVALLHFAVQANRQAAAETTVAALAEAPDDALIGTDDWASDVINWGLASSGVCVGADGVACTTTTGAGGRCRAGRCCTGCWNGSRCVSGRSPGACGLGGGTCIVCADEAFCSSASCVAGACTGDPCDDHQSCTTDTCHEDTDGCDHEVTSGCIIGGECVDEGARHVAYPCLVCDSARDGSDWSAVDAGSPCGGDRCAFGREYGTGTCDAAGTCDAPAATLCESSLCDARGISCVPPCTATSCERGQRCTAMLQCMEVVPPAGACTSDVECSEGLCADGLCCDRACDGTCEACDMPGHEGVCRPIPAGTDPKSECGASRVCDGAGACVGRQADAGVRDAATGLDASVADAARPTLTPSTGGCAVGLRGPTGARGAWALALGLVSLVVRARRRAW